MRQNQSSRETFHIESLEPRRLFAAGGTLDTTFDGDGLVPLTDVNNYTHLEVLTNGKTLALYQTATTTFTPTLRRFNADGSIDASFGINGKVDLTQMKFALSFALQDDGKIVLTGRHGSSDIAVLRLKANGVVDTSFDGDGLLTVPENSDDFTNGTSIAIEPDRTDDGVYNPKYVIAGEVSDDSTFDSTSKTLVLRLNNNGSIDKTFDVDGFQYALFHDYTDPVKVLIDTSGTPQTNPAYGDIVVLSYSLQNIAGGNYRTRAGLVRYRPDGSIDATFDGDGRQMIEFGTAFVPHDFTILPNGDYIVVGNSGATNESGVDMLVARVLSSGYIARIIRRDAGGADYGNSVLPSNNGGFLVFGKSDNGTPRGLIAAFTADGSTDLAQLPSTNGLLYTKTKTILSATRGSGSKRYVTIGIDGLARYFDPGANMVGLGSFDTEMNEAGPNGASLIIYRTERLPYATRVYLQATGNAIAPGSGNTNLDFTGFSNSPIANYVDIPANQTFTSINLTPIDDTRQEGTEYVKFSILKNAAYDIGSLPSVDFVLYDNETDETIVDNTQAIVTSAWSSSTSSAGYYGADYLQDESQGKGQKSVRFNAQFASPGYYTVYARWTADGNRATNVPIDVTSAGGTTTVTVNQQQHGGEWVPIGTYQFNAGGGSVTIRNTNANGYVIADAVRFTKTIAPQSYVKDTTDAGVTVSSGWTSSNVNTGYLGTGYLQDGNTGKTAVKTVTYKFDNLPAGKYEAFAIYTSGTNRATNAKYTVNTTTGAKSVFVNQQNNGGTWVSLGTFDLSPLTATIVLSNDGANGYVIADGVKLVRVQ